VKTFPRPINLNATQLLLELSDAGFNATRVLDNSDGTVSIDVNEDSAANIIQTHNGILTAPEPTIAEKLASVGLTIDDLKAALGL